MKRIGSPLNSRSGSRSAARAALVLASVLALICAAAAAGTAGCSRLESTAPPAAALAGLGPLAERADAAYNSPGLGGEHPTLPFPRSAVVRLWELPAGLTLAEVRAAGTPETPAVGLPAWAPWAPASGEAGVVVPPSAFYLCDRRGTRCVAGPGVRARVLSVRPDRIEFLALGVDGLPRGVPFMAFPYLLTCDPASGRTLETGLYLDLSQPALFGGWCSGHVLAGLDLESQGLVARFDPPSPGSAAWARPSTGSEGLGPPARPWTAPPCAVRWLADQGLLVLHLAGTTASPGLAAEAESLAGRHPLVSRVTLRPSDDGSGLEILLQVRPPAQYSAVCSFGEPRTVVLKIQRSQGPS